MKSKLRYAMGREGKGVVSTMLAVGTSEEFDANDVVVIAKGK